MMENQLIVYTPKKNVKKIILLIFIAIIASILIFVIAVLGGALFSIKSKWSNIEYVELQTTDITVAPDTI